MYYIRLCYCPKSHYIIIWHVFSKPLYMYIRSIRLQTVLERNRRSTWRCWLREHNDALGGHCGGENLCLATTANEVCRRKLAGGVWRLRDNGDRWGADWVTGSRYFADPGVDRHHLIIQFTHYIFPSTSSHTVFPSFHRSAQIYVVSHGCVRRHILLPSAYTSRARGALSRAFSSDAVRALLFNHTMKLWT